MKIPNEMYPVAIIQDRYNGSYSGAPWVAVVNLEDRLNDLAEGPFGSDPDAMNFWCNEPDWIAGGVTPDLALISLMRKHGVDP